MVRDRFGKIAKVCFILLALGAISIPCAVGLKMRGLQFKTIDENRTKAEIMEGSPLQILTGDGSYCTSIQDFFNDRFGFRDVMIRAKHQIEYSVFGMADGIHVGEDGYLAYELVTDKVQITNERMTEEEMNGIVDSFANAKAYLDERGIGYYMLLAPQKNEVFPERFTNLPVKRNSPNNYEILCDKIQNNESLADSFIDATSILREAESQYPTYYKTDFHWSYYGATKVYTEVVNAIARDEGLDDVFSEDDYEVVERPGYIGSQTNDLAMLMSWPTETEYATIRNTEATMQNVTDGTEPNGAMAHYINQNQDAPLGRVLMIGDSYTWYMISANSGILDCFKEVYWVHVGPMAGSLTNYQDMVDYVIFEQVESGPESSIYSLTWSLDGWYTE